MDLNVSGYDPGACFHKYGDDTLDSVKMWDFLPQLNYFKLLK